MQTTSGVSKTSKRSALRLFIYKPFGIVSQASTNEWKNLCTRYLKISLWRWGADGYKYVLKKGVPNKRTFAYEGVGIRFSSLSCVRTN